MRKLTKTQVMDMFKAEILPTIKETEKEMGNGKDSIWRSEEWANYTDRLCTEGLISERQYDTWTVPSFC